MLSTTLLYQNDLVKIRMIKEIGFEVENFDIILADGTELEFKNPSKKELVYTCQVKDDSYTIYADRGPWVQVFKNSRLIAGWQQNDIQFGDHDYQIRGEEVFDAELIISFCLIYDDIRSFQWKSAS